MVLPFFFPATLILRFAGPEGAKNLAGKCPPPDSNPFSDAESGKISPACQANSPQARIAASSSRNAVSFSSARTTKRFPSSRCASAIQIVRPLESIAETQPQLQPALGIVDHLRRRFARFKLCAHFLDLRGLFVQSRSELCDCRLEVLLLLRHRRL